MPSLITSEPMLKFNHLSPCVCGEITSVKRQSDRLKRSDPEISLEPKMGEHDIKLLTWTNPFQARPEREKLRSNVIEITFEGKGRINYGV